MGLIDTAASVNNALALVEQTVSPAAIATRWLLHTLPGGLYIESPAGVVTGPFTATGGTPSFASITLTGTGGAGYLKLPEQSAAPTFAANNVLFYADASNRPAWIGENNKTVAFDATANAANAVYTLPPATDTLVGLAATQTLTNKTLTAPVISGGTIDNTPIGTTTRALGYFSALREYIGGFAGIITHANSADRTYTLPNFDGTLASLAGVESFTNKLSLGMSAVTLLAPGTISVALGANFNAAIQVDAAPASFASGNAGVNVAMQFTPGADLTQSVRGLNFTLQVEGSAGASTGSLTGMVGSVRSNETASTVSAMTAASMSVRSLNAGATTLAVGFQNLLLVSGAGNITTGYDFRALAPSFSSTGQIVTHHGFHADNMGNALTTTSAAFLAANQSGSVTANYAIFTGTGLNHLGDNLEFDGQAAKTITALRNTTSNTAGNNLTLQSGGATVGATDKAAGALALKPGLGTGSGVPALIELWADALGTAAGTSDHTQVRRLIAGPTKLLTNNSAITIVNATLASNTLIGGVIRYTIEVFDGTNLQVESGEAFYSGYNKAGVFACTITEVNSQQNLSSGTLATTWAISGANPAAISINANSGLTPSTGYPRITYTIENFAQQAVAIA